MKGLLKTVKIMMFSEQMKIFIYQYPDITNFYERIRLHNNE